jgi:hypothetical protein
VVPDGAELGPQLGAGIGGQYFGDEPYAAVNARVRIASAVIVSAALLALVAGDLWDTSMRPWWSRHSFTGNVVSSLLIVGVTALIFDELVARRQRKARAVSVAVQAAIVYGQARRVYDAVIASDNEDDRKSAGEDLRNLAGMLLTAGPVLFDDPQARQFLANVERLAGSIYRAFTTTTGGPLNANIRERLKAEMAQLVEAANPLIGRIPVEEFELPDSPELPDDNSKDGGER